MGLPPLPVLFWNAVVQSASKSMSVAPENEELARVLLEPDSKIAIPEPEAAVTFVKLFELVEDSMYIAVPVAEVALRLENELPVEMELMYIAVLVLEVAVRLEKELLLEVSI